MGVMGIVFQWTLLLPAGEFGSSSYCGDEDHISFQRSGCNEYQSFPNSACTRLCIRTPVWDNEKKKKIMAALQKYSVSKMVVTAQRPLNASVPTI